MIPIMCVLQQEQVEDAVRTALGDELNAFTTRCFGSGANIDWIEVAAGSGFTAGMPSRSVLVSMQSNRLLAEPERKALLEDLSDRCLRLTDRKPAELVVAIRDPGNPGER